MAARKELDATELAALEGFLDTSSLLQRRIDEQLRASVGLTQMQYDILTRLAGAEGKRLRMTDLAEALVASRSGLSYQVAQLEKAGYVRRTSAADDERGVLAVLTATGGRLQRKAAPVYAGVVRDDLLGVLSAGQVNDLTRLMRKASTHLRAQQAWPRRASS